MSTYTWSRKGGYECSSKGDKRFSAFYAKLSDGCSIEHHYQVNVKGYTSIKEGKGKPPKNELTKEQTWEAYLSLWERWSRENPTLIKELMRRVEQYNNVVSDCFASGEINQARALSYILNNIDNYIDDKTIYIIIAGSRLFDYRVHGEKYWFNELDNKLKELNIDKTKVCIVSGGAKGVDLFGERYANENNMRIKRFIPDWETIPEGESYKINKFGKKYYPLAGHVRNKAMGDYSDVLIAIWDKRSTGTKNMITYMRKLNKEVVVFTY